MKFTAQAPWRGKGIFRRVKSNRDKAKALVVPRLVSPGGIIRASVGPPDNTIPGFAAVLDSTGAPLAWPIVSRIEDAWTTRGWRVPDDFAGHSFVVRIIRPGADTLYAPVIVAPSTPPH